MPKQKPNEQVQQIPLSEIRPFKNHPFKVTDDELMQQTIDSIMQVGVLNPAIIRPAPEGGKADAVSRADTAFASNPWR